MFVRPFAILTLLLAAGGGAMAQETGGWSVTSRNQPQGGVPILCSLTLPAAKNAVQVNIRNQPLGDPPAGMAKHGPATVRILVPEKLLKSKHGELPGVGIVIEGQKTWSAVKAQWRAASGGGYVSATLENDVEAVLKPVARGEKLGVELTPPGGAAKSYSVSLAGSGAAVAAFRDCLAQIK